MGIARQLFGQVLCMPMDLDHCSLPMKSAFVIQFSSLDDKALILHGNSYNKRL